MKKKRLCINEMSSSELIEYYDDYCNRYNLEKDDPKSTSIWWAMYYTWKDCGDWIEYDEDYLA